MNKFVDEIPVAGSVDAATGNPVVWIGDQQMTPEQARQVAAALLDLLGIRQMRGRYRAAGFPS